MEWRLTEEKRAERRAFLERRQLGIGGSDLPAILGVSQYANALDVYHQKTRPIREEDVEDDSIHQLRGSVLEPVALAHYWLKTGRVGRAVKKVTRNPAFPAVAVSLDFEVFTDPSRVDMEGVGVGEIKCPVSSVYRRVHESGLRDAELVQLQTNIAAARRTWGSFCYFNMEDKDGPVLALDQRADPAMGEFLLRTGQRFWDEHVVPRVAPDPKAWRLLEDRDAPKLVDLSGELRVLPDDDAFARRVAMMLEAKDTANDAEENYRQMQRDVLATLMENGIGKAQIPGLARLTVVTKKGAVGFDVDRLRDALPLDRDKVERWLREQTSPAWLDKDPAAIVGRMLFECQLDLEVFRTEGAPSQYLLPKRSAKD